MFQIPVDDQHTYALKPMNCPGHMLLFRSRCTATATCPCGTRRPAPLHRNELAGALHGLTRVRYVTQDDAHIFCARGADRRRARRLDRVSPLPVRAVRDRAAGGALDAAGQQARVGRRVGLHGGQAGRGARAARDRLLRRRGRGVVLRAEDRPARHRLAGPLLAAGHDPARRADACPVRAHLHGCRQPRASGLRRPSRVLRLVRAVHRPRARALRRSAPDLAGARAGACAARRRAASRGGRRARRTRSRRPASGPRSTSATRRWASGSATRSWQKIPYVVVWGDRESREAMAVRKRGGEGVSTMSLDALAGRDPPAVASGEALGARTAGLWLKPEPWFAWDACTAGPGSRDIPPFLATLSLCKAGAASPLTSPAERRARFNRVGSDEGMPPLHAVAFQRMRRIDSAW